MVRYYWTSLTYVTFRQINTWDKPPVRTKYYRYDNVKVEITENDVSQLLKGIDSPSTERTNPPYCCSPVLLFRKNKGKPMQSHESWRLGIDYRNLNTQTEFSQFPMQ